MQEEWAKQRKALREKRIALASAIAAALGATLETFKDADATDDGRYLKVILEGRSIGLYFGDKRVEVSGAYPLEHMADGSTRYVNPRDIGAIKYDETPPSMGCSDSKSAEAIAKDIKRRFLPDFVRIYDVCAERIKRNEEAGRMALKAAREMASTFGNRNEVRAGGQEATFWTSECGPVRVTAWDGRVSIRIERSLDGLTVKQAAAIFRALEKKVTSE